MKFPSRFVFKEKGRKGGRKEGKRKERRKFISGKKKKMLSKTGVQTRTTVLEHWWELWEVILVKYLCLTWIFTLYPWSDYEKIALEHRQRNYELWYIGLCLVVLHLFVCLFSDCIWLFCVSFGQLQVFCKKKKNLCVLKYFYKVVTFTSLKDLNTSSTSVGFLLKDSTMHLRKIYIVVTCFLLDNYFSCEVKLKGTDFLLN